MHTDLLLKELQAKHEFPAEEFPKFLSLFEERIIKKNELLFQAGDVLKKVYFIIKGCMRQYYVNSEGIEHIIFFAEESLWAGEMDSFLNAKPTNMSMQALEDCELLALNRTNWEYATRTIPDYALYQIKNRARSVVWLKEQLGKSMTDSPDEKYRRLMKETPHLLQRLPQYHIANYLGVTPETLSRIRKRNTRL